VSVREVIEEERLRNRSANGVHANDAIEADDTGAPPWAERVLPIAQEWYRVAPPARTWLLRDNRTTAGALPIGKVGMLIGEGGVSKTMALVSLAIAVATGTTWIGVYDVETSGRVLLLLGEEDADEVHRRAYNAAQAAQVNPPPPNAIVALPLAGIPCPMVASDPNGEPEDAPFLLWLRDYVAASGPWSLIVVDPLSRFAGADAEVDNAAATRFVQALESLATMSGAFVMAAHHTNKTARGNGASVNGASARGSSAFFDGVRWACSLSAERIETGEGGPSMGELVTLAVVKSNYSMKGDPVLLRRDHDHGGALVPMHGNEVRAMVEAREAADPRARRRAEREADRETKATKDEADRERRLTEREAAVRARDAEDDHAVRLAMGADPTASVRALVAVVKGARACGGDRAFAAVHRARPSTPTPTGDA
jgi:RecA-family ATPase